MNQLLTQPVAYEDDYVAWLEQQVVLLRERQFDRLDLNQLIVELDYIVGTQRRELRSRLRILIMPLLKCQFQPGRKSSSWTATLSAQRSEIEALIEESPSLRPALGSIANKAYQTAVRGACAETGLQQSVFPSALPYTVDELLDPDFEP